MKTNNTNVTKFTLTSLLPDWRFFKTAIEDLRSKGLAHVVVDGVVIWNQEPEHTVTAELSATNADYIQIVQRVLGSQSNGELESISFSVEKGLSFSDTEVDDGAELTMTNTPEHTEQSESGHHNEDKVIYGGWN